MHDLRKKYLTVILVLLCCGVLFVASCSGTGDDPTLTSLERPHVTIAKVENVSEEPVLNTFGSISFKNKTDLSAGIDGTLLKLSVHEGNTVFRDQVLAEIQNVQLDVRNEQAISGMLSSDASLQLAEMKLKEAQVQMEGRFLSLDKQKAQIEQKARELSKLRQTVKNKEELFKVQGVSEEELVNLRLQEQSAETEYKGMLTDQIISNIGFRDEDLQREYDRVPSDPAERKKLIIEMNTRALAAEVTVAKARVQSAQAELNSVNLLRKDLQIRAPYQGVIGARYLSTGERVQTGAKVYTIFQDTEVYAIFPLQESEIRDLRLGQQVTIKVPSLGDREYRSRLSSISPTIDPQSGNLNLKVSLSNGDKALRPGMFVDARVITGQARDIKRIPQSTIVSKQRERATVFTVVNGRLYVRDILLGKTKGDTVEVLDGLSSDSNVVNNPAPILREGMEVETD